MCKNTVRAAFSGRLPCPESSIWSRLQDIALCDTEIELQELGFVIFFGRIQMEPSRCFENWHPRGPGRSATSESRDGRSKAKALDIGSQVGLLGETKNAFRERLA